MPNPRTRRDQPARSARDQRRRELSQNYLRSDGAAAAQFLRQVDPDPGGLCLEPGAGEGILTVRLAEMFREVTAYEVDPAVAVRLQQRLAAQPPAGRVRVITGDFLAARPPREPFQVAGNAPFSVTSPIVDWCLSARSMTSATLITQLEYARKRTGAYGRWSLRTVSTWPQVHWELRGRIGREQFRPVPRVDAGILRITRRGEPLIPPSRLPGYQRLVQVGFTGIGGSLLASLRRDYPAAQLAAAFRAAGVERGAVVAFVSPGQWIELFRILDHAS